MNDWGFADMIIIYLMFIAIFLVALLAVKIWELVERHSERREHECRIIYIPQRTCKRIDSDKEWEDTILNDKQ